MLGGMVCYDLLFLLASDWFVLHAETIGLLPGLDQDGVESVSVAARTPIQRWMAAADRFTGIRKSPELFEAANREFLEGLRDEPRALEAATDLVARYSSLEWEDIDRLGAVWRRTYDDDYDEQWFPAEAIAFRDRLDAIASAGSAGFTSWDESIDLFRGSEPGRSLLVGNFLTGIAPWRLLERTVANGGITEDAVQALGLRRAMKSTFAQVAKGLPGARA
jgi:hypothetical protein